VALWRDVIASLALIALLALRNPSALRIGWRDLPFFAIYGFVGMAIMNGLWAYSVHYNGAAVATVLAYASPAFTVLLARPLLNETWTARKMLAVALSLMGCAAVARAYEAIAWQLNLPGILTGVGTGLVFSFFGLAGRYSNRRFATPWTLTAYGFLFAALALSLTQDWSALFSLGAAWDGWAILAALALGPSLIGFGLYTASLRYLPAGVAGLIITLEPALAALLAVVILSERLDVWQWLGVGMIVAAVVLVQTEAVGESSRLEPTRSAALAVASEE
jgi:drug/metabolite transporter (DMT)-like permease